MIDGKDMLNEMDFEEAIRKMDDRELSEFTARQVYDTRLVTTSNSKRIKSLEGKERKLIGIGGAIIVFIATALSATINYFLNR